jgi:hypothetical protein
VSQETVQRTKIAVLVSQVLLKDVETFDIIGRVWSRIHGQPLRLP